MASTGFMEDAKNVLFKGNDRNEYPRIGFEGHDRFFVLPAGIPSELVLLWFRKGIRRIAGGKSSALWQQLTPMPTIAQPTSPAGFSPISVRIPASFCFPQTRSFVHLMPGRR